MSSTNDILTAVADILNERKSAPAESSYVASLYTKGLDAILKKVGEEATEVVMAAKDVEAATNVESSKNAEMHDDLQQKVANEVADLWFHSLVLLAHQDLHPDDVLAELERRFGTSGIVEKASRKQ